MTKSAADHLSTIHALALESWGEGWIKNLVRQYCEILADRGIQATTKSRRSTVLKAVTGDGGCNAQLLIDLYAAVDCEIKIEQRKSIA